MIGCKRPAPASRMRATSRQLAGAAHLVPPLPSLPGPIVTAGALPAEAAAILYAMAAAETRFSRFCVKAVLPLRDHGAALPLLKNAPATIT